MKRFRIWWHLNIAFWWSGLKELLWINALWPGDENPDEKWEKKWRSLLNDDVQKREVKG